MRGIGTLALIVVVAAGTLAAIGPALAAAVTCESFQGPDCGGAEGDAACGDPALDCVDTGNGCACQTRACCRCESVAGSDSSACDVPCEDATLDMLPCAGQCLSAASSGATCNLTVMANKRCANDTCVPTGCCAVTITPGDQSPPIDICVATDAATCATPMPMGHFVAGGRCDGGVFGKCVPTLPNGDSCTNSAECQSGFCVDGVCCNTACNGPSEQCNVPGQRGTCAGPPAPAPALAPHALFVATTLLAGIAAFALRRRRVEQ